MEQNTDISLNITDSLDDLLILKFWKIIDTNDYCMLFKNWNSKQVYTDEQKEQANKVWLELYDEYYEQCKDGKSHNELNKDNKEHKLFLRIKILETVLKAIASIQEGRDLVDDDVYAKMMNDAIQTIYKAEPNLTGKLNVFDDINGIYEKCKKLLKSLEGQYTRLTDDKPKRVEKAIKKVHNVYERSAYLHQGNGFYTPINNMCVNEWIALDKALREKIKASKNGK